MEEQEAEWVLKTGGKVDKKNVAHKRKHKTTMDKNGHIVEEDEEYEDDEGEEEKKDEEDQLSAFTEELHELRVKMRSKEEAWSSALRNTEELLDLETEKLRECEKQCNIVV